MIFGLHGEQLHARIEARTFGDGPAEKNAVQPESKVVVETRGGVLLDEIERTLSRPLAGGRLIRDREVPFASIFREVHRPIAKQPVRHLDVTCLYRAARTSQVPTRSLTDSEVACLAPRLHE